MLEGKLSYRLPSEDDDSVESVSELSPNSYSTQFQYELAKRVAEYTRGGRMLPDDFYTNMKYHRLPESWLDWYLPLAERCRVIALTELFSHGVLGTIMVAGLNVGAQTYDPVFQARKMDAALMFFYVLDIIIFAIFAYEMFVKIFAEGLRFTRYWTGPEWKWNNFDFAIVVMTFPALESVFKGGSMVALLRLARLARLGKLIKRIPALQMIVKGLIGGIMSIGYIMLLLFIVFYIYAVVGVGVFSVGDPFHWEDLPTAMLSLFRVATLANWGDMMFLDTFGCDEYPAYYEDEDEDSTFYCNPDTLQRNFVVGPIFFITFVTLSAFVMLSLFIGAITMNMADSMDELKTSALARKRAATFERNRKKITSMASSLVQRKSSVNRKFSSQLQAYVEIQQEENEKANLYDHEHSRGFIGMIRHWVREQTMVYRMDNEERDKLKMQRALVRAMGALDVEAESAVFEQEARERQAEGVAGFWKYYIRLGYHCEGLANNPVFNGFIVFVICVAGVNVGLQLEMEDDKEMQNTLGYADIVIIVIFVFEVVVKIVAEKLQPLNYFFDNWNKFDFIIVISSLIPGAGSELVLMRLLRLLRVLKLVKKLPQLAVIVNALMTAMSSISYVALILLLALYVFAIVGMLLFGENDPWHFGSLHLAMIALIRVATLDEWTEVMYLEMYGSGVFTDVYDDGDLKRPDSTVMIWPERSQEQKYQWYVGWIYFTIFILLVAQVLLTLFIGVISTSMDESREAQRADFEVDARITALREELGLSVEQMRDFKMVFDMLDLDGGGRVDLTELSLGLCLIDEDTSMSETEMHAIFQKCDEDNSGSIDVTGFVHFMCLTPKYRLNALKKKTIRYWEKKVTKKHDSWYEIIMRGVVYGAWSIERQKELKAALTIQSVWKSRKEQAMLAQMKAKREAIRNTKDRRRMKKNSSILDVSDDESDAASLGSASTMSEMGRAKKYINSKPSRDLALSAYDAILHREDTASPAVNSVNSTDTY